MMIYERDCSIISGIAVCRTLVVKVVWLKLFLELERVVEKVEKTWYNFLLIEGNILPDKRSIDQEWYFHC